MELIHEGVLQYNGSERRPPAHCYVRIYLPDPKSLESDVLIGRPIIIACQMDDNHGQMSVTNKIELVATIAWREHIPSPERWNEKGPIVIQHYHGKRVPPGRAPHRPDTESFDLVEMDVIERPYVFDQRYHHLNYARWLAHPVWMSIPRERVEQVIGQPFPPFPLTLDEVSA